MPQNHTQWCEICQMWGHVMQNYAMPNEYQKTYHTTFCEFCKSIGHDIKSYRALDLMRKRSAETYRVQEIEET